MPRISLHALVAAFSGEILVDMLLHHVVLAILAGDLLVADMSQEAIREVLKTVAATTPYLPIMFTCGSLTTVAGAYLAARLAKRIPYYHGLAMGIIGLGFSLFFWSDEPIWLDYFGLLITVPLSLFGAHLARRHMPELGVP
jgi:hypothetical protein